MQHCLHAATLLCCRLRALRQGFCTGQSSTLPQSHSQRGTNSLSALARLASLAAKPSAHFQKLSCPGVFSGRHFLEPSWPDFRRELASRANSSRPGLFCCHIL